MDVIANGVRLHYIESGSGYPVICIPGNGLSIDLWRHLIPQLSGRYRTIAFELRGMQRSEAPGRPGVTFTNEDHARDLVAFLDALNIDRAAIVAHAFGGFVAMRAAIDHPERFSLLVIANPSAKVEGPSLVASAGWSSIVEAQGMEALVDAAMTRWFLEEVHRERPEIIQLYREMYTANPPMGYAANARGIGRINLLPELNKIQCPTLLLPGNDDRSTPSKDAELIAEAIPHARLIVVPGTSHTVPEEQSAECNRITLEFLGENVPG